MSLDTGTISNFRRFDVAFFSRTKAFPEVEAFATPSKDSWHSETSDASARRAVPSVVRKKTKNKHSTALVMAGAIALVLLAIGFVTALIPPIREFGILFPAGLLLLWMVGFLARRGD